jgi:hypothetical protein
MNIFCQNVCSSSKEKMRQKVDVDALKKTERVPGQSGLYRETLSRKTRKKKKKKKKKKEKEKQGIYGIMRDFMPKPS